MYGIARLKDDVTVRILLGFFAVGVSFGRFALAIILLCLAVRSVGRGSLRFGGELGTSRLFFFAATNDPIKFVIIPGVKTREDGEKTESRVNLRHRRGSSTQPRNHATTQPHRQRAQRQHTCIPCAP
mgnify:FL=1